MSNWSFSQAYIIEFQSSRSGIESRIDLAKSGPANETLLHELSVDLAKLSKSLADATGSLPSYDQRQCEQQLKLLEKALIDLQTSSKPRSKFSFKKKPQTATPPPPLAIADDKLQTAEPLSIHTPSVPTTNLTLSSRSYEYITFDSFPQSPLQHDLTISDLDHCIVNLIPPAFSLGAGSETRLDISALHARNLNNTILMLPVVDGSVLLHDLQRCVLVLGCRQFRMHSSTRVDVYLSIPTTPIIEHSAGIRFTGYPSIFPSVHQESKHTSVQDFSHIRSTQSPNWSIIDDEISQSVSWPVAVVKDRHQLCNALESVLPLP